MESSKKYEKMDDQIMILVDLVEMLRVGITGVDSELNSPPYNAYNLTVPHSYRPDLKHDRDRIDRLWKDLHLDKYYKAKLDRETMIHEAEIFAEFADRK